MVKISTTKLRRETIISRATRKYVTKALILLLFVVCSAFGCSSFPRLSCAQLEEERHLIVISIDGCRWDYLQDENLPNLRQMMENGAVADHMVVTNPSMTATGHITLLTGAWTDKHGIMLNKFYDRQLGFVKFFGGINPEQQVDYLQAEPLWVPAEDAGLDTAAVHWAATAGEYEGREVDTAVPFYYTPNDHDRIEHAVQIIKENKPNLLLVYTVGVAPDSYEYGPGSDQVKAKLRTIDGWIGEIFDAVKEAGLWNSTDFIITSDHGFTEGYSLEICPTYVLETAGIEYDFVLWGAFGHIFLSDPDQAKDVKALFVDMEGVDGVYTKAEIGSLNLYNLYNENRCGDVVIVAKYGYQVAGSTWGPRDNAIVKVEEGWYRKGSHGYPGNMSDMWGIFLAYGPHIKKVSLGEVLQIDVAPTIASILGFSPPKDAEGEALDILIQLDTSLPVAEAGSDRTVKVETTVTFDASGSYDNVGIVKYEWNFGDGTHGEGVTANHSYTKAGTYIVILNVTDAMDNWNTDMITITVEATPSVFPWWIIGVVVAVGTMAATTVYFIKVRKTRNNNLA